MEEEREIDLYLAEQEFCEEMCEEVERLYVESAVPAATEPPVTKPSATELAAALAAEPVSAAIKSRRPPSPTPQLRTMRQRRARVCHL